MKQSMSSLRKSLLPCSTDWQPHLGEAGSRQAGSREADLVEADLVEADSVLVGDSAVLAEQHERACRSSYDMLEHSRLPSTSRSRRTEFHQRAERQ